MSLQDIIKCTDLLAEKDAIIAERDEWKAIAQSYEGCLEGIALKLERKKVAELVLENRAYDLRMDNDAKRIAELQDELSDYWWYALQKESGDKGEGWISPYMSEGEYAGPKRRGRGEPLRDGRADDRSGL